MVYAMDIKCNNVNKQYRLGILLKSIIVFSSFVVSIILAFNFDKNDCFKYMFILPLVHSVVVLFSRQVFINIEKHISRLILVGGYTIRNIITPLFISLGGYEVSTIKVNDSSDILFAALLMSFETVIVFLSINYESIKQNKLEKSLTGMNETERMFFPKNTVFSFASVLITLIMIIGVVKVPSIFDSYQNLWTAEDSVIRGTFSTITSYSAGSVDRLLYAFFLMFFSVMQVVLSIYFIRLIRKIIGNNSFGIVMSYGIVFLNTLFVSETSAYTMFVLILLVMYMIKTFEHRKNSILFMAIVGLVIVLFLMIVVRTNTYHSIENNSIAKLATFLNAYFPGIVNVSVMPHVNVPSKLISFYFDIYKSIPLQSLIPSHVSGERLSNYFNYAAGTSAQILPFIGQTYFYFWLFGPIIQVIVVHFALKWELETKKTNNYIKYIAYLTASVIYSFGCTMYDLTIILAFTFKTVIPFIILAKCTDVRFKNDYHIKVR